MAKVRVWLDPPLSLNKGDESPPPPLQEAIKVTCLLLQVLDVEEIITHLFLLEPLTVTWSAVCSQKFPNP
jgi:hypothetical protein